VVASSEQVAARPSARSSWWRRPRGGIGIVGERGIVKSGRRAIVICHEHDRFRSLSGAWPSSWLPGVATLDAPVSGGTERAAPASCRHRRGDPGDVQACRPLRGQGTKLFHDRRASARGWP